MSLPITTADKNRFNEIRKDLQLLGAKESSFLKIELLFYEALNMAKKYNDDLGNNSLLASLRKVQMEAYEKTKAICKTSAQKERLIHQFIVQFKKAIASKPLLVD